MGHVTGVSRLLPAYLVCELVEPMHVVGARLKLSGDALRENRQFDPLAVLRQEFDRIQQIAISRGKQQRFVSVAMYQRKRCDANVHALLLLIPEVVLCTVWASQLYPGITLMAESTICSNLLQLM